MFFDKFVIESENGCFSFTSETWIWLFRIAISATTNLAFFTASWQRIFRSWAAKHLQLYT